MNIDELTAREQIRHTMATYNRAGDDDDAQGFADCFTEDGVFDATVAYVEGREAIRKWKLSRTVPSHPAKGASPALRVHHTSSVHIEFATPDLARSRACWLSLTDIGPDHTGIYYDEFRRVGERWLIAKRTIHVLWRAENSSSSPIPLGRGYPGKQK